VTVGVAILLLALVQQATDPAAEIDRTVRAGIEEGIYPGAVVVVGTANRVLHAKGYGHFTWSDATPTPDPARTLFDLASLTKVVAATGAAMALVDDGLVGLDDAVQRYLPAFRGEGKEQVTVRHLLEHRSGLRAFLPLNDRAETADAARAMVLEEPLRYTPGTVVEYSDLNAMLLGWVIEAASGEELDVFVARRVFRRTGMMETVYRPAREERARIMPVGRWRGVAIAGEVHDQNAAVLGGVSGHAGLYGTGLDLARFAQLMLADGRARDGTVVFRPGLVRYFTRPGAGHRALGWEMRDLTENGSAGSLLTARAFGHGGYTGTSIWIDPELDVFVIVLTNRVFAPRTGRSITKLKVVRGEVADWAVRLRPIACAVANGEASPC
jgi:CubicO group peptidase (beta-lactamase class C family)